MTEIETVLEQVKEKIAEIKEIDAVYNFPGEARKKHKRPVVSVAVEYAGGKPAGFFSYIGRKYAEEQDKYTEIYGKRLSLAVSADIRCPADIYGGSRTAVVFGSIAEALSGAGGIKIQEMSCGETSYDRVKDCYFCRCRINISAFIYASLPEGEVEFTDFTMKGEIKG